MLTKESRGKLSRSQKEYNKEVDAYKWFIVDLKNKRAITGWEFRDDAKEALSDYDGDTNFKVVAERTLESMGIQNPKESFKETVSNIAIEKPISKPIDKPILASGGETKPKKVIRRNLPINKTYKLIDSFYTGGIMDNPMSCENCGRPIANVAVIQDEDGRKFDVGMDCAETLSQIKSSSAFMEAANDFAEANSIRSKIRNALKKSPDAVVEVENTPRGTVYLTVNSQDRKFVGESIGKAFFFKYLPEYKAKITNPDKNQFYPRLDMDYNIEGFVANDFRKDVYTTPKEFNIGEYTAKVSRETLPNYNEETGEIRNYNNFIIIKVYKDGELIGDDKGYMHQDIARKIFYAINEYEFNNYHEPELEKGGILPYFSYNRKVYKDGELVLDEIVPMDYEEFLETCELANVTGGGNAIKTKQKLIDKWNYMAKQMDAMKDKAQDIRYEYALVAEQGAELLPTAQTEMDLLKANFLHNNSDIEVMQEAVLDDVIVEEPETDILPEDETAFDNIEEAIVFQEELSPVVEEIIVEEAEPLMFPDENEGKHFISAADLKLSEESPCLASGTVLFSKNTSGGTDDWQILYFTEDGMQLEHLVKSPLSIKMDTRHITYDDIKNLYSEKIVDVKNILNDRELDLALSVLKCEVRLRENAAAAKRRNSISQYALGGNLSELKKQEQEDDILMAQQFGKNNI